MNLLYQQMRLIPSVHLGKRMNSSRILSLLGVPVNLGQPLLGPDRTPQLLRDEGLINLITSCGWRLNILPDSKVLDSNITSKGDYPASSLNARNCHAVGKVCGDLHSTVKSLSKSEDFILIIGGDHCIPIGTITGLTAERKDIGIVWVDAHADINTPDSSSSGNMHGMPLAFLLGLVNDAEKYPSLGWFKPCLKPSDIVYIGLRDLDPPEKQIIKSLNIKAFTMYDVDRMGIGKVMEECLSYLEGRNIHLSYDIDALDPFFAPHTGTAVRGGLTFREGNYICESLFASGKLTSMELVEVNPSLHQHQDAKLTIEMALTLIGSAIGQRIL